MMTSTTTAAIEITMIVLWNVLLKKINYHGIRKKNPTMDYTTKYGATGKCTLDNILKNTGGDVHYENFLLPNSTHSKLVAINIVMLLSS